MATFPKFFRHRPLGNRYQIALIMNDESAPGVVMTFQHEVYDYRADESEAQHALFHYQPDVLLSCSTTVLPSLAEIRHDPEWEEGAMNWKTLPVIPAVPDFSESTGIYAVLNVDGSVTAVDDDPAPTNLFFV